MSTLFLVKLGNKVLFNLASIINIFFFIPSNLYLYPKDNNNSGVMSKTFFQFLTLLIIVCGATTTFAQSKPAYQLFTAKGKRISYSRMLKKIQQNDVILFGELHNNPISHWLELELAID